MQGLQFVATLFFIISVIFERKVFCEDKKYEANWVSLDARPVPKWFDDSKIGLMVHWGVYSVPAIRSGWMLFDRQRRRNRWNPLIQYLDKSFKVNITYPEFAPSFTAALFNPNSWAKLFKKAGVKYVVLTGKHFDGYTLWPSNSSINWNSMDVGPKLDLFGDLGNAVRSEGLRYGVYYSLFEWFNPLLDEDLKNNFSTNYYIEGKIKPELSELVTKYKPDIIRAVDGWLPEKYCKSREFLAWLYNESPVKDSVVVNDRWGTGTMCKHGGVIGCSGRHQPNSQFPRKWESAVTLDRTSWGFNRLSHSYNYLAIKQILKILIKVVSGGGNVLFNLGATQDGRIPPIMEERLLQLGEWLEINGIAVYNTEQWKCQQDTKAKGVYYTKQKQNNTVFAIITKRHKHGILRLFSARQMDIESVSLITRKGDVPLMWRHTKKGLFVILKRNMGTKWFKVLKLTGGKQETDEQMATTEHQSRKSFKSIKNNEMHIGFWN